ncbi:MAG: hypothetical protein HYW28_01280 [Rhodospirillales bacterium]|nr:hypothetical protein [Rhodospirillales bacterium]
MCLNVHKARYLKMLIDEIKAEIGKRKARKAEQVQPAPKPWPAKHAEPALAAYRE